MTQEIKVAGGVRHSGVSLDDEGDLWSELIS
jgi:hypothetical protein